MRCASCGDLVNVVVMSDGQPVGACGWEGVLTLAGQIVPNVQYWATGVKQPVRKTLRASEVKQVHSAAANLRPLAKILASRAVEAA